MDAVAQPASRGFRSRRRCVTRSTTCGFSLRATPTCRKLRLRNIERAPRIVRWLTSGIGARAGRHRATRLLKWLERSMPRSAAMRSWLEELAPDVMLLTSLTFSRSLGHGAAESGARARAFPSRRCDHELGPSLQQGAAPRCARHDAGLERGPEARSGRRCTACPRRQSSSPARSATTSGSIAGRRAHVTSSAATSGSTRRGRSCCMSVPR